MLYKYREWTSTETPNNTLISMANAAQFLQAPVCLHYALSMLADRCENLTLAQLRSTLNETEILDEEMHYAASKCAQR